MASIRYRGLMFAALVVAALVVLLPTFVRPVPTWWPRHQPVRRGLDLQGGTHLLYQVQIDQAVDNQLDRIVQDVQSELRTAQIGAFTVERQGRTIQVRLANHDKKGDARRVLEDRFRNLTLSEPTGSDAPDFSLAMNGREEGALRDRPVAQPTHIIRNPLHPF